MRVFRSSFMRALRHRWPRIKRMLPCAVLVAAAVLLYYFGRSVDWAQVWRAMRAIPPAGVALAAALSLAGYLAYGGMDLLARRYTGHGLPWPATLGVAMLSYALNQNLGVLLGGLGARLRLYARLGARKSVATRVALFSAASNWIGYGWLAGALFLAGAVPAPRGWEIGAGALRLLGAGLLAASLAYVLVCAFSRKRSWTWMGQHAALPGWRMALAQSAVAVLSWSAMGAVAYVLLQGRAPYAAVLGILLCASFAAVITRVPGGLGTTEAILVTGLSSRLPAPEVLGAALAYRAVYALAPLCLALAAFALIELRARSRPARAPGATRDRTVPAPPPRTRL